MYIRTKKKTYLYIFFQFGNRKLQAYFYFYLTEP